jgi:hypothetical protein
VCMLETESARVSVRHPERVQAVGGRLGGHQEEDEVVHTDLKLDRALRRPGLVIVLHLVLRPPVGQRAGGSELRGAVNARGEAPARGEAAPDSGRRQSLRRKGQAIGDLHVHEGGGVQGAEDSGVQRATQQATASVQQVLCPRLQANGL